MPLDSIGKGSSQDITALSEVKPASDSSAPKARRAWTIKNIQGETVERSRQAAQHNGMMVSLWVEKQLRAAAERELAGDIGKAVAAEIMATKIENIESALLKYIEEQDRSIAKLQDEIHMLNNNIIPPLLQVLAIKQHA